jgi:hypothetical protein
MQCQRSESLAVLPEIRSLLTHKTFVSDSIVPVRITMGEPFSLLILAVYPGNHTPLDNLNTRRTRDTLR